MDAIIPRLPCAPIEIDMLCGRTVDLERIDTARHAAPLWRAIGADPGLWDDIPPGPFADEAAFTGWLGDRAARPGVALFAATDTAREPPEAAGLYFLMRIEPALGSVEIGLVLGRALSRRTAATEAFRLIAGHVFAAGYRRLEWRCNLSNAASARAALRFGFTAEGVMRQTMWIKGRNWDTALYAMLDHDWPAAAARLDAWLAPENFTADGKQITALSLT
jgi:RimJ/RimL family protein N-acetyltransferase